MDRPPALFVVTGGSPAPKASHRHGSLVVGRTNLWDGLRDEPQVAHEPVERFLARCRIPRAEDRGRVQGRQHE
jgi:hypothetical protein